MYECISENAEYLKWWQNPCRAMCLNLNSCMTKQIIMQAKCAKALLSCSLDFVAHIPAYRAQESRYTWHNQICCFCIYKLIDAPLKHMWLVSWQNSRMEEKNLHIWQIYSVFAMINVCLTAYFFKTSSTWIPTAGFKSSNFNFWFVNSQQTRDLDCKDNFREQADIQQGLLWPKVHDPTV